MIIFKEFENLSVEKKTLSTALGFEPRPFDCRSTISLDVDTALLEILNFNLKKFNSIIINKFFNSVADLHEDIVILLYLLSM